MGTVCVFRPDVYMAWEVRFIIFSRYMVRYMVSPKVVCALMRLMCLEGQGAKKIQMKVNIWEWTNQHID